MPTQGNIQLVYVEAKGSGAETKYYPAKGSIRATVTNIDTESLLAQGLNVEENPLEFIVFMTPTLSSIRKIDSLVYQGEKYNITRVTRRHRHMTLTGTAVI